MDVRLIPYHTVHGQYTSVYWDVLPESGWAARKAANDAERQRRAELDARTVDLFRPGRPGEGHRVQGEKTDSGTALGRISLQAPAGGWFSLEMSVVPGAPQEML